MGLIDLSQYPRPDVLDIGVGLIRELCLDELVDCHLLKAGEIVFLIEVIESLIEAFLHLFLRLKGLCFLCFLLHIII